MCTGSTPQELADQYTQYGPLKTDAGEAVVEMLLPIQARYNELMTDRGELASLLRKGAAKAGQVAEATLERAYTAIGFLPRWHTRLRCRRHREAPAQRAPSPEHESRS